MKFSFLMITSGEKAMYKVYSNKGTNFSARDALSL